MPNLKKRHPKVIQKKFANIKDAPIYSECNNGKIIKIYHWSPKRFTFMRTQKMMVFCNYLDIDRGKSYSIWGDPYS